MFALIYSVRNAPILPIKGRLVARSSQADKMTLKFKEADLLPGVSHYDDLFDAVIGAARRNRAVEVDLGNGTRHALEGSMRGRFSRSGYSGAYHLSIRKTAKDNVFMVALTPKSQAELEAEAMVQAQTAPAPLRTHPLAMEGADPSAIPAPGAAGGAGKEATHHYPQHLRPRLRRAN